MARDRLDVEEVEPGFDGCRSAGLAFGEPVCDEDPSRTIHILPLDRVPQCRVPIPVRFVPVGRASVQVWNELGLGVLELTAQRVPEKAVVAEPGPAAVERNEKKARIVDRVEFTRRIGAFDHRIAERAGNALENRSATEKRQPLRLEREEAFGAEEVGEVAVVTGERSHITRTGVANRERGEVEARRPALGAAHEACDLLVGELDSTGLEQGLGLTLA